MRVFCTRLVDAHDEMDCNTIAREGNVKEEECVYVNRFQNAVHRDTEIDSRTYQWVNQQIQSELERSGYSMRAVRAMNCFHAI